MATKQNSKTAQKIAFDKKRATVLVDPVLAGRLRELLSLTATRHTMSSVVSKDMHGAARFLEKRYGPFPRTPAEREIRLRGGMPPQLPSSETKARSGSKIPITVYVDGHVKAEKSGVPVPPACVCVVRSQGLLFRPRVCPC